MVSINNITTQYIKLIGLHLNIIDTYFVKHLWFYVQVRDIYYLIIYKNIYHNTIQKNKKNNLYIYTALHSITQHYTATTLDAFDSIVLFKDVT